MTNKAQSSHYDSTSLYAALPKIPKSRRKEKVSSAINVVQPGGRGPSEFRIPGPIGLGAVFSRSSAP